MWHQIKNDAFNLSLKIKPNAKQTAIVGSEDDYLKVNVHAPPVDGAANKELIRFLAEIFKVPKSNIQILQGEHGRFKRIKLLYDKPSKIAEILKHISTVE